MLYNENWTIEQQEIEDNETFLKAMPKPSLEALSYSLRHPETWPPHFQWDFRFCASCALGLARRLWRDEVQWSGSSEVARCMNIPREDACGMFLQQPTWRMPMTNHGKDVTAADIADVIDSYLSTRKA